MACADSLPTLGPDSGADAGGIRDSQQVEAPVVLSCSGQPNGTVCVPEEGLICIDQVCRTSRCNDGYVDPNSEDCEDGNEQPGDGCSSCRYDCAGHEDCLDDQPCNGQERCDPGSHRCQPGDLPPEGTSCKQPDGADGLCNGGVCASLDCGDKHVNSENDEECDDGNDVPGDGCEPDCTWTCEEDEECEDGDVCNGVAKCDSDSHTCVAGDPLKCDDERDCTEDSCDPAEGCQNAEIDGDGDGKTCEDDCNDDDPSIYFGAPEYCDDKDNDCNDKVDDGQVIKAKCYRDSDKDSYAPSSASAQEMCACTEGYTIRPPKEASDQDCYDRNPDVHPAQTAYFGSSYCRRWGLGTRVPICLESSWDYNCDQKEQPRDARLFKGCEPTLKFGSCCCSGWVKEVPECGATGTFRNCSRSGSLFGLCATSDQRELQQTCR